MARRWAEGPEADKAKDPSNGSGAARRRWRAERPGRDTGSGISTARTKRRWARWSPEPMAAAQDIPTTDPAFLRPPDAHLDAAARDRTGWPWVTGTPAPTPAPEAAVANGDDDREEWVSPRRRQFWGGRAAAHTEGNGVVATEVPAPPAEMPAVTDEPEHHASVVEALAELQIRDLDRPRTRRFRRDRMAPRPADWEAVPPPVAEPAPQPDVAEAAAAPAVAEADAAAAVAEVPAESSEEPVAEPVAAPEESAKARRRWFGLRSRVDAEEAAWDAERPKWPWITQANGTEAAASEAPAAVEPEPVAAVEEESVAVEEPVEEPVAVEEPLAVEEPVAAEEPVAPVAVEASVTDVPEEPKAPLAAVPAMPVVVPDPTAGQPADAVAVGREQAHDEELISLEPQTQELPVAVAAAAVAEEAVAEEAPMAETPETEEIQAAESDEEIPPRRRMWRRANQAAMADAGASAMAPVRTEPEAAGSAQADDDEETPRRRAMWRRQAATVATADAAGAAAAAGAAGMALPLHAESEEEESERSRWAWLGTKQVAVVILLLLAAEVGYVVHLNTQSTANNKAQSPPVTQAAPPTTAPIAQAPATTVPAAAPAPTPTTAPKPAPAAAPVVAAKSAPIVPCTTSDLSVVTTTSGNSVGAPVSITTTITALHACIFQPAAVPPGNCPTWIAVDQYQGPQVFPSSTQVESCNPPAGQTMNPGSSESVSVSWRPPSAGTYQAVGIWGWASQSGSPNQISMPSQPFSVS